MQKLKNRSFLTFILFRIEIILVVVGGLLGIFTNLALIYGVVYFRRYCSYLPIY